MDEMGDKNEDSPLLARPSSPSRTNNAKSQPTAVKRRSRPRVDFIDNEKRYQAGTRHVATAELSWTRLAIVCAPYMLLQFSNGLVIGGFGPAVEALKDQFDIDDSIVGTLVLIRGCTKFIGVVFAGLLASSVYHRNTSKLHFVIGIVCMAWALAVATFSVAHGVPWAFTAMIACGFAYGTSDTMSPILSTWFATSDNQVRGAIYAVNVNFGIGALVAPLLIQLCLSNPTMVFVTIACPIIGFTGIIMLAFHPSPPSLPPPILPSPQTHTDNTALGRDTGQVVGQDSGQTVSASRDTATWTEYRRKTPTSPDTTVTVEPKTNAENRSQEKSGRNIKRGHQFLVATLCVVVFIATGSELAFGTWVSPYASMHLGADDDAAAFFSTLFWTSLTVSRLINMVVFTTCLRDTWTMLAMAIALCLASAALFVFTSSANMLAAVCVGFGTGVACIVPGAQAVPREVFASRDYEWAMSVIMMALCLGEMALPFTAGLLFGTYGEEGYAVFEWMLLAASGVAMIALLLGYASVREICAQRGQQATHAAKRLKA